MWELPSFSLLFIWRNWLSLSRSATPYPKGILHVTFNTWIYLIFHTFLISAFYAFISVKRRATSLCCWYLWPNENIFWTDFWLEQQYPALRGTVVWSLAHWQLKVTPFVSAGLKRTHAFWQMCKEVHVYQNNYVAMMASFVALISKTAF